MPEGFKIDGVPGLSVLRLEGDADIELQHALQRNLRYDPILNLITMRVPFPPLDRKYRLEWRIPNLPSTIAIGAQSVRGRALNAVRKMLALPNSDAHKNPLNLIGQKILDLAIQEFKLDAGDRKSLEFSIMAYDAEHRILRCVAASFADPKDPRWNWPIPYGDGIAGRVYKNKLARVFVKQLALINRTPFYYLPTNAAYVSSDGGDAPEVMVSVPLYVPGNRREVFAVLSVSSKDPASKLVDVSEEEMRSTNSSFSEAVADACLKVLEEIA
jgi:hypothetical protein